VAERPSARRHKIQLEYRFDRLLSVKLEQVYQLLVPEKRWQVGSLSADGNQGEDELNEQTRRHPMPGSPPIDRRRTTRSRVRQPT
jgi:hypothetical protein